MLPPKTINCLSLNVKFPVATHVHSAPGHSQKKELSPGWADCYQSMNKLKYVKGASSVIQFPCVQSVTNVQNVASNPPVGARLQHFWKTWLDLGLIQTLKEGYTIPFQTRPKLTRSPTVVSCYVNPHRNSYLLEALHQLIDKNAVELVHNQTSLGFGPQAQQQMETYLRCEQTKPLSQGGEIQNGNTGNHQDIPPIRGVGLLNKFQGHLLPHSNTGTVQEIPQISCPGSNIPIQGSALWSVHSTLGVHCSSKRGETDGLTQGYKNPPVPRRLVGESHIPPGLSPTYQDVSPDMSGSRLAGKFREIRAGTQTNFRLCGLLVRPPIGSYPTHTRTLAKPSTKNTGTFIPTVLSGPGVHVLDRFANSHRETSLPRSSPHETNSVAFEKQLESTRIPGEGYPNSQVLTPSPTMVVGRQKCTHRPTTTPSQTRSANFYRRIKRRVGRSLRRAHYKRNLVVARKQTAYNYLELKAVFLALKEFQTSAPAILF